MQRRKFLQNLSLATILLADGTILKAADLGKFNAKKPILRFVVASDGHYGQPKTDYQEYFDSVVKNINLQHAQHSFDACIINGDIIHDDKKFLPEAKQALDKLALPYQVTQGNHDKLTSEEWEKFWGVPVNYDLIVKKNAFLFGTTSDINGKYLAPDINWFSQKLEAHKDKKNIFIFIHITPVKWTDNGVNSPEFRELLKKYPNVKAIFNGHDHDQDAIKMQDKVPFLFDAHFGGSWGTTYRGFRIVELMKDNTLLTYILNPDVRINESTL